MSIEAGIPKLLTCPISITLKHPLKQEISQKQSNLKRRGITFSPASKGASAVTPC